MIADSQLAATSSAGTGNAVVAFMNPGGIRADLVYKASGDEGDGVVTYGEAFTVQPFTNLVETISLTGAQIVTLLQEQFTGPLNTTAPKVLQVSQGFTYTLDRSKTGADKVDVSSIRLNGAPLDPSASYRVTVNNFLAGGGDGFSVLTQGTDPVVSAIDVDAFVDYLTANSSAGVAAGAAAGQPDHGPQLTRRGPGIGATARSVAPRIARCCEERRST